MEGRVRVLTPLPSGLFYFASRRSSLQRVLSHSGPSRAPELADRQRDVRWEQMNRYLLLKLFVF